MPRLNAHRHAGEASKRSVRALVGVRRFIGEEPFDFRRGRGQAGQVEGEPSDQGPLVGLEGRFQPLGLEPRPGCSHRWATWPTRIVAWRVVSSSGAAESSSARPASRSKAPVEAAGLPADSCSAAKGAHLDPAGQGGDLGVRQLGLRGILYRSP